MPSVESIIKEKKKQAEELLRARAVGDVEFSGHTYQVQVTEGDEELWPFFQFDESGEIKDSFCSCEAAEEEESCVHLAAALLHILGPSKAPLHERFGESLWHILCQLFSERQGYNPEILRKDEEKPGHYALLTPTHKLLFAIEAKNEEAAQQLGVLLEKRVKETEETSLKFSGLSHTELTMWREGRPPAHLRYELSFWSDLAKWMLLQQDKPYSISFETGPSGLPNHLNVDFADLRAQFYLSEANLSNVVPALATVDSPLKIHHFEEEAIESVQFDRTQGTFHIEAKKDLPAVTPSPSQPNKIEMEEWFFVPGDGFYSKEEHNLLGGGTVPPEQVGTLLAEHAKTLSKHIVDEEIHLAPVEPAYELSFNDDWSLHVRCYLFNRGDLEEGDSRLFGSWAYLEDDGFYPLKNAPFTQVETVIPAKHVSDFVHQNRVWLNGQEGFHTHLTAVESHLTYQVSEEGDLSFEGKVELSETGEGSQDFGEWVYIAGQGFYSKTHGRLGTIVHAGTAITKEEIPLFLRMHAADLELIEGFFTSECPIEEGGLDVSVLGKDEVELRPTYTLKAAYRNLDVHIYENYVYVAGEGFSEIPQELRLPERFRRPMTLKGQELKLFLSYELEELRPCIQKLDRKLQKIEFVKIIVSSAEKGEGLQRGLVSLDLSYESAVGRVPMTKVWRAMQKHKRFLFSKAGLLDLKDARYQWLSQIPPARVNRPDNRIRLTMLELIRLSVLEPMVSETQEASDLLESLASFESPDKPNLDGLKSTLRHYQEIGVHWLWFLYRHSLSGMLCDDMGLGKTHQSMALLAGVANEFKGRPTEDLPHYLVVCPTSVIYHWREKLAEFLPSLRVYVYYGAQRTLKNLADYDVILTSYGVLRSEKDRLSSVPFELAIYDEVQVAKNVSSQTHKALNKIRAHMRVGLTGTPIENSLRELKSLFDLVLPGYLPSERQFRDTFILPIERDGDEARKAVLRRIVHPFMLRRKKEEVLTELPDKMEEKSHCDLSAEQQKMYNDLLSRSRDQVLQGLDDNSKPAPYLHIFSILTSLKRICDHPAVHLKDPTGYKEHASGKWELFKELLSQARESEQKVVVFSQYLGMLDIIELYLKEAGIGYAGIRGSTRARDKEIERFQKDPNCEVFVGSLQAAGLGIELTAASVVIHYDRWWNAARENQATDRVHRLGQTRGVQVFKLLTVGTLEERIDHLIETKGALMEEVVGSDEQGQIKNFTREELIELLSLAS